MAFRECAARMDRIVDWLGEQPKAPAGPTKGDAMKSTILLAIIVALIVAVFALFGMWGQIDDDLRSTLLAT